MKLILVFNFIFAITAYAGGDRIGNGGQYVVCNGSKNVNYFYDYYELTKIFKKTAILKKIFPYKIFLTAHDVIERQSDENRLFKNVMHSYIEQMKQNMIVADTPLGDTNDNPNERINSFCKTGQAAVSGNIGNNRWTFNIFGPAWDLMDYNNQTALILHEVIYRLAFENGQQLNVNVRTLNQALMLSGNGWTDEHYIFNLRKKLNLLVTGE